MKGVALSTGEFIPDCLPERWREIAPVNSERGMLQAGTSLVALGQYPKAQITNPGPCHRDYCVLRACESQIQTPISANTRCEVHRHCGRKI